MIFADGSPEETFSWIVATGVIAVGIALAGICITLAAFILNTVRDIRADMRALLERQDKLAERLGRVEEGQAQLSERLVGRSGNRRG